MILFIKILLMSLGCVSVGVWVMYQSGMLNGIREPNLALSIALYLYHIITPTLTMVLSYNYKIGYLPVHILFGIVIIYHWYYVARFLRGDSKSTILSQSTNFLITLYPIVIAVTIK